MTDDSAAAARPAPGHVPASGRAAGRPRDDSIDQRVLAETRRLLVEEGWDELSVRRIAARAGVGRASIDRRWSSKAELVLHAVLGAGPDLEPFAGADASGWIDWVVRGSRELFARPDLHAAVPGLLTALRGNSALRAALWRDFSGPAAELYASNFAADARSHRDAVLDAKALIALAAGAALFTSTVAVEDDTPELYARIGRLLGAAAATQEEP